MRLMASPDHQHISIVIKLLNCDNGPINIKTLKWNTREKRHFHIQMQKSYTPPPGHPSVMYESCVLQKLCRSQHQHQHRGRLLTYYSYLDVMYENGIHLINPGRMAKCSWHHMMIYDPSFGSKQPTNIGIRDPRDSLLRKVVSHHQAARNLISTNLPHQHKRTIVHRYSCHRNCGTFTFKLPGINKMAECINENYKIHRDCVSGLAIGRLADAMQCTQNTATMLLRQCSGFWQQRDAPGQKGSIEIVEKLFRLFEAEWMKE